MASLSFVVVSLFLGCGPGERGFQCDSDDQCAAGLQCIATEEFNPDGAGDEQCVEGEKLCTNPCVDDADCAQFGDGLICASQGNVCAGACLVGSRG